MKEYSYIKRALLRELSENSRMPVTNLAKKLKCSRNTVLSNIRFLEKEFGMHYTVQFNKEKIGLMQNQVWCIKFGVKPDARSLVKVFENDAFAEFVAQTEGDFDLLMVRKVPMNLVAGSGEKYIHWSLATGAKLMEFRPLIRFSLVIVTHTGFTPMLKETLENLEMENLGIDSLDKSILILLNENSRMTYRALAKKLNEDVETIRYRFRRITKLDMIKRFTIVVERPPAKYNMAFFMDYALAPGIMERSKEAHQYYLDLDGRLPLINTFQYLASTSGSYIFFGMGCFENQEKAIQDAVIAHKKIYNNDNPVVHYAKITNMIKGLFPVRNIDVEKDFLPLKS